MCSCPNEKIKLNCDENQVVSHIEYQQNPLCLNTCEEPVCTPKIPA